MDCVSLDLCQVSDEEGRGGREGWGGEGRGGLRVMNVEWKRNCDRFDVIIFSGVLLGRKVYQRT